MLRASRCGNEPCTPGGALSARQRKWVYKMPSLNAPYHDKTVIGRVCSTVLGSRTLVGIAIRAYFIHPAKA